VSVDSILAVMQVLVGVLSRPQGLEAGGIHSLSDLVADFVELFASHHAERDADAAYSCDSATTEIDAPG
jgi:divalent metal cation (Fe/Co/Zn/Cd) transporter